LAAFAQAGAGREDVSTGQRNMDLEEVWRIREEDIYPSLFGPAAAGIYPLSQELFSQRFRQTDVDPRWLFCGVFQFPPTPARTSWLYVTSGHSNPWDQEPDAYNPTAESGFGVEFVFLSSEQGDWAIQTLQNMLAFDLLLGAGRFPNAGPLALGNRVPLHAPINGDPACAIRNLVLTEPEGIADGFSLPSGRVLLAAFTGISDAERDFAKTNGSAALIGRLRAAGCHPVTNPRRKSLL
jgi:hypothetical protein